ncbi:MAG: BON domain-containing protein, partial [Phycisphaerales bacterium]|nr:BON domain-containing protein [Phycisphaerales bacterium]
MIGTSWPAEASAQQDVDTPPIATETDTATSELTASDQTVDVATLTADDDIGGRLNRILAATGRFEQPNVTVKDGVVFLAGRTRDPANRTWAADLARKTEGVVAVVNNIDIHTEPIWTLAPAKREIIALWREFVQAGPLLLIGLLVFGVVMFIARLVIRASRKPLQRRIQSDLVRNVIEKIILVGVGLIGIYLFLRISGLTRIAVTLAGGTGLVGLAVGFAFRDIAENF